LKKRAFIFWLGVVTFIFSTHAQTNAPVVPEKRVLFIVETSRETKPSADAGRELVSTLIQSGMAELIGEGDTIGVWTFNDKASIGQLPMQRWSADSAQEIANRVAAFLKLQRYENEPKTEPLMKPLSAVIRTSPTLTIVMVTSSRTQILGTPYDIEIRSYFKEHEKEFRKKKMPFVTMFLTRRGKIVRYSVGPALGDVKIPKPLPEEPKPAVVAIPPVEPPPMEKRSDKALVITKTGAVKTSVEEADQIADAARIEKVSKPAPPEAPTVEERKNERLPLAPGSAVVTGVVEEKYLVKGGTNVVLLQREEATNAAATKNTNAFSTPVPNNEPASSPGQKPNAQTP
jgi:hypothetical protein